MTAEFALAMPAVMTIVLVLLGAFSVQLQRFDLSEQAAYSARAFARGERLSLVESWLKKPNSVDLLEQQELTCAIVTRPIELFGFPGKLLEISAKHCARRSGL